MIENHLPAERPHINKIPRSIWLQSDEKPKYSPHKPTRIVVHHSWKPTTEQFKGDATIRGIHDYHTKTKKWSDIGYHFLISPDGSTIYIGRPADAQGAHCGGDLPDGVSRVFGNTGSIGICLVGDYDTEKPSGEAMRTLAVLIVDLCERYNIKLTEIYGHCEAWSKAPKSCPGKYLFEALFGEIRWKALKF